MDMEKTSIEQLSAIKDYLKQTNQFESKSVEQIRQDMAETAATMPSHTDVTVESVKIGSLHAEWVIPMYPALRGNEAILYFHVCMSISGSYHSFRTV